MVAHSVKGQGRWKQNKTVTKKTNIDRSPLLNQRRAFSSTAHAYLRCQKGTADFLQSATPFGPVKIYAQICLQAPAE